jgi:hypothetical protein
MHFFGHLLEQVQDDVALPGIVIIEIALADTAFGGDAMRRHVRGAVLVEQPQSGREYPGLRFS